MAEDIIEDTGRLFKRVGNEEILYPADDQNFALREKKLMRTQKSYSAFTDIQIYKNDLESSPGFPSDKVMLPNCVSQFELTNKQIYKVTSPGFIYSQRWSGNTTKFAYTVYIDGGYASGQESAPEPYSPFSDGDKYLRTTDSYPDPSKTYYIRSGSTFTAVSDIFVFSNSTTYYEKYGRTYFTLFSSRNGSGSRSNNMFPICPGKYTHIAVGIENTGVRALKVVFIAAAGYDPGGGLQALSGKTISSLAFNKFTVHNAGYIFRK